MENEKVKVMLLKTADGREANLTDFLRTHPAFVIGTDARASLRLLGVGVEAAHAVVTRRGTEYFITPRMPSAKVIVNGERITLPRRLNAGDTLHLGAVPLSVTQSETVAWVEPAAQHEFAPAHVSLMPQNQALSASASVSTVSVMPAGRIYYPKTETTSGVRLSALLSGVVTLLVVAFVIGYGFMTSSTTSANDITSQFAYKDGHVTVVMFDADW